VFAEEAEAAVLATAAAAFASGLAAAHRSAGDLLLDALLHAAGHRDFDAVGNAHVHLAGSLVAHLVRNHDAVGFVAGLAHGLVASLLANFLASLALVAGHALLDRDALMALHDLLDLLLFPNLVGNPVTNAPGVVVLARFLAAGSLAATARTARVATAVVTAGAIEPFLEATEERQLLAAFPVATILANLHGLANFFANRAVFVHGPLFRVRNPNLHANGLFMAFRNKLLAGNATGPLFRNALRLASRVGFLATFVLVAGLLDHVGFRNPFVATHGDVLRITAAA
jgi:hypothetical protein